MVRLESGLRARGRILALCIAGVVVQGCYALQPVQTETPLLGTVLSLSINDAGRVALAQQMGPSVLDVEGRLLQLDTTAYVLAVTQVGTVRGGTQVWSGERVSISREYVSVANEKQFSRSRTVILGSVAVGLVAILATQKLLGSVAGEMDKTPPDSSLSNRIPAFIRR